MANFTSNLTTATNSTAQQLTASEKQMRWTFTGTYTGVVGTPQGSNNGTDYVNLTGVREDNGTAFNGTISNGNFSMVVNVGGWTYVRFLLTAISTGTITIRGDTGANYSLPLGITPISIDSVGTTITTTTYAVGANGVTNPTLRVDASAGSVATGWVLTGAAAAAGAALTVISSGTNEDGTVNAKGSGTITLGDVSTGNIVLARATGVTGALTGTSTSASALTVGANGLTNPVIQINANTASVATGVAITGAAAAARVAIAAISSGTNEGLDLNAKGSGTVRIGNSSTGSVLIGGNAITTLSGTLTGGGVLTCALQVATSGPLVYSGSGVPTISAAVQGSLYLRSDGSSTTTRMYVATNTAGTWTAVSTVA